MRREAITLRRTTETRCLISANKEVGFELSAFWIFREAIMVGTNLLERKED